MTKDQFATGLTRAFIGLALACGPCMAQGVITTLAGGTGFTCGYSSDGTPASATTLCGASYPVADPAGNIYFTDNSRIRKIGLDGAITTIAGNGAYGTSGDGGPALSASLGRVQQIAVYGTLVCFADAAADKIRCMDQGSGLMYGFGTGVTGTGGDGGPFANASFMSPQGLAFDDAGNLYISDFAASSVRRANFNTGIITMFAGPGPGYCCAPLGDGGPALGANLYEPNELFYRNGALYIADQGNLRVRRVDLGTGLISTVAGDGSAWDPPGGADGGSALLAGILPRSIALDQSGNLFITTEGTIREVSTSGIITTIAAVSGNSGYGYDDVLATQTVFGGLDAIGWDPVALRLLIADNGTRIRQIFFTPPTTTTLTSTVNPTVPASQITLQATVSPVTATGSVRFYLGTTGSSLLASVPLVNGVANLSWTAPMGNQTYAFRAVYSGDASDNLSLAILNETVQQGTTTTTVTSSANPSQSGQNVTFTVTVNPPAATGTVYLINGYTGLGGATLSNGVATFNVSNLAPGSNSIYASYPGSGSYLYSNSATLTQVVQAVQAASTTSLTATPNPSLYGAMVTLTANVVPAAATGSVQFFSGSVLLGSASLAAGQAQLAVTNLPAGSDSLTAVYAGNSAYTGSTSAAITQAVRVPTVATQASTENPTIPGQAISIIVTVTPASNIGALPTGSVQLLDGATVLGTANLLNGGVQFPVTFALLGTHALTAVYAGDANFLGSTSAVLSQAVLLPSAGSISSSLNPATAGSAVTFTATVFQSSATGNIQFQDYGASASSYVVLGSAPVVNGGATFTTSTLSVGTHNITANYLGDTNYLGFSTSLLPQVVNPAPTGLITTIAGTGSPGTAGVGGPATSAQLSGPYGIVLDSADNLFAVDGPNNRVVRVDAVTGTLTLVAGNGTASSAGDAGPAAQASLNRPYGVALDAAGNLYIAEFSGQRIRRVDAATGIITTFAGSGTAGWSGDGGPAANAQLAFPMGIAADSAGNLFIADAGNALIRRVDAQTGTITTIAGNGAFAFTPDGVPASGASLAQPQWVSVDRTGNILVSEWASARIRRIIAATGLLGTVAGNGSSTFTGDGIPAVSAGIGSPQANVAADSAGNLFFADGSGRIRRVDAGTGLITTVAGNGSGAQGVVSAGPGGTGSSCYSTPIGDNGPATNATLDGPAGVGLTRSGNLVLSDWVDCRVRRVSLPSPYAYTTTSLSGSASAITLGQTVTFTATVSPIGASGAPTGNIQFVDAPPGLGATVLGNVLLSGGAASLALSTLQANGAHQIVAYYSGDASYNGSGSPGVPVTVTVQQAATVALSSSQNPAALNTSVTFTATVTPPSGNTNQPSGSVQLHDGSTVLGTVSLTNGAAQFSASFTTAGTHALTAVYAGDSNFLAGSSAVLNQAVKNPTVPAIASDVNPSAAGSNVTFTATVTPSGATGAVEFVDTSNGSASLGIVPLAAGSASLAVTTLSAGAHAIVANYSGDSNYLSSSTSLLSQVVKPATTTSVSAPSGSSAYGQSVSFTASVAPAAATGTVQFFDGAASLGSVALTGGTAVLAVSSLSAGTHSITAAYSGDSTYSAGTSAAWTQTVAKASTTAALSSSANPSMGGQAVTLTAAVSPGAATGTVQFLDGTASLGTAAVNGGTASLSTAALASGSHSITAVYSGDGSYATVTSAVLAQTVKFSTTTALSSPGASTYGQPVTFTASVTPAAATGSVQFLDGATVLGTATVSGGAAALTIVSLPAGAHAITAAYSGDNADTGSASVVWTQNVAKAGVTAGLAAAPNPSLAGQTVTLTATVSPASAAGNIQFLDDATVLGTVALTGGAASMSTAALAVGNHSLTAIYSGDANFSGNSSAAVVETVKRSTVTTVTSNHASIVDGQTVQFTASVSPSAATGSIQFKDGGSLLGTVALSGGSAVLAVSTWSVGTHSITAVYSGDAFSNPSTSAVWTQTVTTPPAPTLTAAPSPSQANLGQTVTVTLTGTNFIPGATTINWLSGSGVTISNINVVSGTMMTAAFTVAANAAQGFQQLTVSTPGGTSAGVSFQVFGAPSISSISPTKGSRGTAVSVKLKGANYSNDSVVHFSGSGIVAAIQSITNNGQTLNVTFTIAGNAPTGPQNVTVTNSVGTSNSLVFTVQ